MNAKITNNLTVFAFFVFFVTFVVNASASDWIEYKERVDRFGVSMPGQPKIEEFTYTSWRGHNVPARIHSVHDASRYSTR